MFVTLTFTTALATPPGDEATWDTVRDDIVHIECTEQGKDFWCRADGVVAAAPDAVLKTLQNMPSHQEKFELVRSIVDLGDDTLHITIDYPSVFSDRDYVAKYTHTTDGDVHQIAWAPVVHADAPPVKGTVRLERFEGAWRLSPTAGGTAVRYVWHADPGGSFPGWAKPLARKRAGHEAIKDLAAAQGTTLVARSTE
ncbi:MAG: hypothetical protein AAF211_03620 [Myxococcota bacterium]